MLWVASTRDGLIQNQAPTHARFKKIQAPAPKWFTSPDLGCPSTQCATLRTILDLKVSDAWAKIRSLQVCT